MKPFFILLAAATFIFSSCKKDDKPAYDATVQAPLSIEFDNIAGPADLELNTDYTNAAGEQFSISKLKYYVSNFKLTNIDGTLYTVPQDSSYFLIEEGSEDEVLLSVPEGEYTTLSFMVGVDSLRSTLDASQRTGVLDTANGLYWNANDGYIFYQVQGTSGGNNFSLSAGGYGGSASPTANNIKTITLDLTPRGTPKVKAGKETNIHLMADVLAALSGSSNISFSATPVINSPAASVQLAANYSKMFRHDHTEN